MRAKYMVDTERAFITNEAKIAEFRRCGYDSVWIAGAGCCKACTELNGITLKGSFRPPLHGGCTCTVGIGNAYTNSGNSDKILEELKNTGINGKIHLIPLKIDTDALRLDDNHANKERNHNVSHEEAVKFIKNAEVSITRNLHGKEFKNYYSFDGAAYVNVEENLIRTALKKKEYNEIVRGFMEVLETMENSMVYCPLCEHDIDPGDCIENQDCIDGMIVIESLPEEFKKHENYAEICKACKWYHDGEASD